jgi:hypothetical protein
MSPRPWFSFGNEKGRFKTWPPVSREFIHIFSLLGIDQAVSDTTDHKRVILDFLETDRTFGSETRETWIVSCGWTDSTTVVTQGTKRYFGFSDGGNGQEGRPLFWVNPVLHEIKRRACRRPIKDANVFLLPDYYLSSLQHSWSGLATVSNRSITLDKNPQREHDDYPLLEIPSRRPSHW